jgi:hypothetical protein
LSSPTHSSAEAGSVWRLVYGAFAGAHGPVWALLIFVAGVPVAVCALVGAVSLAPPFPLLFFETGKLPKWLPLVLGIAAGLFLYGWSSGLSAPERFAVALPGGLVATALLSGAMLTVFRDPVELVWRPLIGWVILFSVLWSIRVLCIEVQTLIRRQLSIATLWRGAAGALAGALSGAMAAQHNGADWAWMAQSHWFYVLAVPALMGYGWVARPRSRHKASARYAAVAGTYVVASALVALFATSSQPHDVSCFASEPFGEHRFYGYIGEPWDWRADRPEFWPLAPLAVAELTRAHILQPRPSCAS